MNQNNFARLMSAALVAMAASACDPETQEEQEEDERDCVTTVTESVAADAIWGDDCKVYAVPRSIRVQAGLVVRPETAVVFGQGAGLEVEAGGTLTAVGTEEAPVVFRGAEEEKGFWSGIVFRSNSSKNELTWARVSGAGASGYHFRHYAVLVQGRAKIARTVVQNAGADGLVADKGASLAGYAENTFEGISGFPVVVYSSGVGELDGASTYAGSEEAPNAKAAIRVLSDVVKTSQTWRRQDVPYRVEGWHRIADADAVVTVEPGAQLNFEQKAGLEVEAGALSAVGTEEAPVVFRGEEASRNFWSGIAFRSNSPKNELTWARVSDTGASGYHFRHYALLVQGRVKLARTVVESAGADGLVVDKGASLAGYAENRFEGVTGFPVVVPSQGLGELDGGSDYAGTAAAPNDKPWIKVLSDVVTKTQTWRRQSVPYRFAGSHRINDAGATVTVEPGARLEFEQGAQLDVEAGTLSAAGSEAARIVFTGVDASKGFWSGLTFVSNAAGNVLDFAEVSYAGASGYHFTHQGIRVTDTGRLSLKNSLVKENREVGVRVLKNGVLVSSNNTFENNGPNDSPADDVDDRNP